ncbi:MAG: hypothetical protein AMJ46_03575 [Latescibacteria bacterium DG_63]|nr:MAG: hypothetical protein AMJ46_03575 [Latescibacteria bacterium DG_63]
MAVKNHDELRIGELPRLQIMPIEDIMFHEEPDIGRVAKLIDRFSAEGTLRNPVVVAVVDGNARRVLLDGTNRSTALKKLGMAEVLVQEIELEDGGLVVSQWHHAIENLTKHEILRHIDEIPETRKEDGNRATDINQPDYLCSVLFDDGTAATLFGSGDIFQEADALQRFTNLYFGSTQMDRVSYTNPAHLRKNYPGFTALVGFKRFTKLEIVELADAGKLLPSGITRVLLPKRALNFNLHLDVLKSELSVEDKNEWLQETIRRKVLDKSIRFYREPTFSFDE